MPRRARLRIAEIPQLVLQRGNNGSPCFFAEQDYRFYLQCLREAAVRYACAIHAYVLMANHVHLLVTPSTEHGLSLMMRLLGSRYVYYVNHRHRRTGTLWEGRFRSSLIDERYVLSCLHFIESNPSRKHLVASPADYPWSSYRHHAEGRACPVIKDHPVYVALGPTDRDRQRTYREWFRDQVEAKEFAEIRSSVKRGLVLGEEKFKDEIERVVARRVRPGKSGRPRKFERSSTDLADSGRHMG